VKTFSGVNVLDVISALNIAGPLRPFSALAQVYSRAEFRTSVTPTIDLDVASLDADTQSEPNTLLQLLRPTLVLSGPAGTKVIAPAGEAGHSGGLTGLLLIAGALAVPFFIGVGVGRRSRRRARR
jgi:hypothetical protein